MFSQRYYYWPFIVLCMITAGCSKDFALKLDDTPPLYVIEGRISNLEGPYFVRVTKSSNQLETGDYYRADNPIAVTNALVILSDDAGTKDTLIPVDQSRIERYWNVVINGTPFSFKKPFESTIYTRERGYYQTTRMKGEPGHTYHLEVQTEQDTFHANAYMPFVPELDSAVFKETVVTPKGAIGLLPYVYFKEPVNEKNYYLLQFNGATFYQYDIPERPGYWGINFPFYVVDDNILPPYVNGLAVRIIFSSHNEQSGSNYFDLTSSGLQQIRLSSLTKEAYEYFRVSISQFEDDGNAYKPVPASAAGNFSGGALGLFYATHVSYKLIQP